MEIKGWQGFHYGQKACKKGWYGGFTTICKEVIATPFPWWQEQCEQCIKIRNVYVHRYVKIIFCVFPIIVELLTLSGLFWLSPRKKTKSGKNRQMILNYIENWPTLLFSLYRTNSLLF
jgi:hypothetical protein